MERPVIYRRMILAVLFGLGAGPGCGRVSASAIERWKSAPDGVDRLAGSLADRRLAPELRAATGAALVEIGASGRMKAAVEGLDVGERAAVVPPMLPLVAKVLDAPDAPHAGEAREALYELRYDAPEARPAIDQVLLPALERDVRAGRTVAARQRVKDILLGMGAVAVPRMLALLEDPAVPFATPVEVVRKLGDLAARRKGGAALAGARRPGGRSRRRCGPRWPSWAARRR
jgi:hypothetical protein